MNQLRKSEIEEEFQNDGFLAIAIPAVGIFIAFAILAKFGFEPNAVWSFIKTLFFPSIWDYRMDFEFTHLIRAFTSIGSIVVVILVSWLILTILDYARDPFENRIFICKVMWAVITLIHKMVMYIMVANIIFLVIRVIYHICAALLGWLW